MFNDTLPHDEPYLSQQEGDLKIEEIDNHIIQKDDLSSPVPDQRELNEFEAIQQIVHKMRLKQEESKELMALEIKKIHEVQEFLVQAVDEEIKEKLQRELSELEEAFKNVKYFYKFIDENCKQFNDSIQLKHEDQHVKVESDSLSSSDSDEQFSNKNYKRGPYKRYTPEIKEEALVKIKSGFTVREVCNEMNIPKKNLRRWIEIGAERKKGGGRKRMDQEMEERLHRWCLDESLKRGRPVSRIQIRSKALEFSKFPDKFKASKGWTDKFVKKYNLRKQAIKQLQEKGLYKQYHQRKLRQQQKSQKMEERLYDEQFQTKKEADDDYNDNSVFESSEEENDDYSSGKLEENEEGCDDNN